MTQEREAKKRAFKRIIEEVGLRDKTLPAPGSLVDKAYDAGYTAANERAEKAEGERDLYKVALADAIRRPMGVVPDSASGLLEEFDLIEAERRREALNGK